MAQHVALGFLHGTSATSFLLFASLNSPPDSETANDDAPPSERRERAPAAVVVAVEHADFADDAAAGFKKLAARLPDRSESAPAAVVVAAELARPILPLPSAASAASEAFAAAFATEAILFFFAAEAFLFFSDHRSHALSPTGSCRPSPSRPHRMHRVLRMVAFPWPQGIEYSLMLSFPCPKTSSATFSEAFAVSAASFLAAFATVFVQRPPSQPSAAFAATSTSKDLAAACH